MPQIMLKECIQIEAALIEKTLQKMPNIRIGKRRRDVNSPTVIRFVQAGKQHELCYDSAPAKLKILALKRHSLLERRKYISKLWRENFRGSIPAKYQGVQLCKNKSSLNSDFYNSAQSQALGKSENHVYFHNGFWMRSRAEIVLAQTFDALGIDYKYEVRIPGTDKYADFLLHFPAFDRCSFVEYLGKSEESAYLASNIYKLTSAVSTGLRINRDLILIFGTDKYIPDMCELEMQVTLAIYNHAKDYLDFSAVVDK